MWTGTLFECRDILFEQPQHLCVIPEIADWCVQYMLEGSLYGGLARNAVAVGWIKDDRRS